MKTCLLLATATLILMHSAVLAQSAAITPCNELPVYRLLDFWVGEWDVFVGEEKVGFNRIEKTLDGCAVLEHWVDTAGNEGKSLFFVADTGTWKQVWVTEWATRPGGVKEKMNVDIAPEDGVRFQGKLQHSDVGEWLDRTTLKPSGDGEVHQTIETSSDHGETWKIAFDAVYRRVRSE